MAEERIVGIDTIRPVEGITPPDSVEVGLTAMKALQKAQDIATRKWMAIMPYCVVCKAPLVWVRNSETLFECPSCGKKWKKNHKWDKDIAEEMHKMLGKEAHDPG